MTDKGLPASGALGHINRLIAQLSSDHAIERQNARHALVGLGKPAIPKLQGLVDSPAYQLRWEAAKALAAIGDTDCAAGLIELLADDDLGIRWAAGNGLINVGVSAIKPLLEALIQGSASGAILEGAHHVLHELRKEEWGAPLGRVMQAIETTEPGVSVPPAAETVLEELVSAGVVSWEQP